jgi:hypothetical protein
MQTIHEPKDEKSPTLCKNTRMCKKIYIKKMFWGIAI